MTAETETKRLIEVGSMHFAQAAAVQPQLEVTTLPDDAGVCLIHTVRGGGKVYVAPDESALFVGSAIDFEDGLAAFLRGERTPPNLFEPRA